MKCSILGPGTVFHTHPADQPCPQGLDNHPVITGQDIYIVLTEDRHADPEPQPFTDLDRAVAYAEQQVRDNARHPESITDEDRELTEPMRQDGWLWYCRYSVEGDSVRILKRELR